MRTFDIKRSGLEACNCKIKSPSGRETIRGEIDKCTASAFNEKMYKMSLPQQITLHDQKRVRSCKRNYKLEVMCFM
jgi:hypothetical protein